MTVSQRTPAAVPLHYTTTNQTLNRMPCTQKTRSMIASHRALCSRARLLKYWTAGVRVRGQGVGVRRVGLGVEFHTPLNRGVQPVLAPGLSCYHTSRLNLEPYALRPTPYALRQTPQT
jgi:hypothetical protein